MLSDLTSNYAGCNITVKFDDEIVLEVPRLHAYQSSTTTMTHNSTVVYPKTTSGILWVGSACNAQFNGNSKAPYYPSMRIDDVSFSRLYCYIIEALSIEVN